VYCQIKLDREGRPFILETAPRLDGCHMWDLIRCCTGADLLDACFRHLLKGEKVLDEEYTCPDETYYLTCLCKETGSTFDRGEFDTDGAEKVVWYYETGDIVGRVNGIMEKCGYMIRKRG
jgi:biotin carboxylase